MTYGKVSFIKIKYKLRIEVNMKKCIKKIVATIIMLIIMSIYTYSFADVGSFDRYDSGGSSWDSGSSWSSSDWGSSSSSWDWDDDYNYSGSSGDLGFLLGMLFGSPTGGSIIMFIVIAIIIGIMKNKGMNRRPPRNMYNPNRQNPVNTSNISSQRSAQVANRIKTVDPLFSEEKTIRFTKELFVKLQNAWTAREWEPMRLFETPELFEQHKNQVQGYIDTNRINVMDRIAVNYAYLYNFKQEQEKDVLEIVLKSTMKDYIIDATTKELLEGSKTQDRHTVYKLTFERKKGVLTEQTEDIKTTNCPNCGAPTKITSAGKCEYCDSVILIGNHGWVLSNLEPFRN